MSLDVREVLLAPVVTEKAYAGVEANKYVFRVHPDAHKTQIRQAVEELFDVKVERVNVSTVQSKPKRRGVHRGIKPGWKKAFVQLRQGDSIEIFQGVQI
ncbi:MAG: 50S ribosomal protein L23 [Acidobacteria bacterium]|jgi:large subunit ribosomal protein L23|nr:50S ribosomal protein L23 [Acidobacteriota bacterium]